MPTLLLVPGLGLFDHRHAAIPPTQREWHDIYQSCKAVIHFFEKARLEYTKLKGPTLGPTGTPSHSPAKPIQMGAVITGMEAKLN